LSDDPFKPVEAVAARRFSPLPPRPPPRSPLLEAEPDPDPIIGQSVPPSVAAVDGVTVDAAAPAVSLTEQQMVALRQAFETVLIKSGSIPPPPRTSIAVKAAEKTVDFGALAIKVAGVIAIFLPVLAKVWPEYIDIIQAVLTAMRTAAAP
jgi:hypothetical protein